MVRTFHASVSIPVVAEIGALKFKIEFVKKNSRLLTWHSWQVSQLSRLRLSSVFTVFLKYFSIIHCFLSEVHSPCKADVDQGQLIYLIYLEDVFLFCPVLSNVFILILFGFIVKNPSFLTSLKLATFFFVDFVDFFSTFLLKAFSPSVISFLLNFSIILLDLSDIRSS